MKLVEGQTFGQLITDTRAAYEKKADAGRGPRAAGAARALPEGLRRHRLRARARRRPPRPQARQPDGRPAQRGLRDGLGHLPPDDPAGRARAGGAAARRDAAPRIRPAPARSPAPTVSLEASHGETAYGAIVGTPLYMSPEQAQGRHDQLDAKSDQCALGLILFELVALKRPLGGKTLADVLTQASAGHARAARARLRRVDPRRARRDHHQGVGGGAAPIATPRSADLADDLRRFLRGDAVLARPDSAWQRAVRCAGPPSPDCGADAARADHRHPRRRRRPALPAGARARGAGAARAPDRAAGRRRRRTGRPPAGQPARAARCARHGGRRRSATPSSTGSPIDRLRSSGTAPRTTRPSASSTAPGVTRASVEAEARRVATVQASVTRVIDAGARPSRARQRRRPRPRRRRTPTPACTSCAPASRAASSSRCPPPRSNARRPTSARPPGTRRRAMAASSIGRSSTTTPTAIRSWRSARRSSATAADGSAPPASSSRSITPSPTWSRRGRSANAKVTLLLDSEGKLLASHTRGRRTAAAAACSKLLAGHRSRRRSSRTTSASVETDRLGAPHILAFDTIEPMRWTLVTIAETSAVVGAPRLSRSWIAARRSPPSSALASHALFPRVLEAWAQTPATGDAAWRPRALDAPAGAQLAAHRRRDPARHRHAGRARRRRPRVRRSRRRRVPAAGRARSVPQRPVRARDRLPTQPRRRPGGGDAGRGDGPAARRRDGEDAIREGVEEPDRARLRHVADRRDAGVGRRSDAWPLPRLRRSRARASAPGPNDDDARTGQPHLRRHRRRLGDQRGLGGQDAHRRRPAHARPGARPPVEHVTDYPTANLAPWELPHGNRATRRTSPTRRSRASSTLYGQDSKHFLVKTSSIPTTRSSRSSGSAATTSADARCCGRGIASAGATSTSPPTPARASASTGRSATPTSRRGTTCVERFIGVSGENAGLPQLPDGQLLPPFAMNCVEANLKARLPQVFGDRVLIASRCAVLSQPHNGRGSLPGAQPLPPRLSARRLLLEQQLDAAGRRGHRPADAAAALDRPQRDLRHGHRPRRRRPRHRCARPRPRPTTSPRSSS